MGSLPAVSRRAGFVMLAAEWGIAGALSAIIRRFRTVLYVWKDRLWREEDTEAHHFRPRGSGCGRELYNG